MLYRKPSLSPRAYGNCTTMIKNPLPCSFTCFVFATITSFSKHAHTDVVQDCAEHGAVTLYVQSPPTIFILQDKMQHISNLILVNP